MKLKLALMVIGLATILPVVGCTKSAPVEGSPAKSAQQTPTGSFAGTEFVVPSGWTKEQISGGLLLMAPQPEAGWQANISFDEREDSENRPLEKALTDHLPNLETRKQNFRELSRKFDKNPNGINYGILEYTCINQGTELREWEVIIVLTGTKRLFILASSASSNWNKYEPTFKALLDSLR